MPSLPSCVVVRDPRFPVGGFETWVETLAKGLPPLGVRVFVLVPGESSSVRSRLGNAQIVTVPAAADDAGQAAQYIAALERLAAQGERGVFFTMGYPSLNIVGLNLVRSPWVAVPVLHGRHPSAHDWLVAGPPARIVVPSEEHARSVAAMLRRRLRWFRRRGVVTVIPHGVALPPLEGKLDRPVETPLRVVAATRLHADAKRPHDLIAIARRALERGVDIRLTIAGSGPEEARMRAEAPPDVTFLGPVAHDRMSSLFLESDVLLSTSESEAFGLSIAEAMACGCAVVAADAEGPVREMVTEDTGRRVAPGDVEGFVDALAGLTGRVREYGARARHRIASRFPVERMLASYADLVRVLAQRAGPDPRWRAPSPILRLPGDLTLPPLRTRIRRKLRW